MTIDGARISYEVRGRGVGKRTPIVFLHGWGVDRRIWMNRFELAIRGTRSRLERIYPDLPGMGASTTNGRIRNSDDMLAIVERFIDLTVGDRSFLLAGESYGGYLARALVERRRGQVAGVFPPLPADGPRLPAGPPRGTRRPRAGRCVPFAPFAARDREAFEFMSIVQTSSAYRAFRADVHTEVLPENEGFLAHDLDGSFSRDINAAPFVYEKPTLVLVGRQDTEVGFEDQYDLFRRWPGNGRHIGQGGPQPADRAAGAFPRGDPRMARACLRRSPGDPRRADRS
jgi:pimeloyl-ACP methyl ester carboxylesterase